MISTTLISTSEGQLALVAVAVAVIGFAQGSLGIEDAMKYIIGAQGLLTGSRTVKKYVDRRAEADEAKAEAMSDPDDVKAQILEAIDEMKEKGL